MPVYVCACVFVCVRVFVCVLVLMLEAGVQNSAPQVLEITKESGGTRVRILSETPQ